MCKSTQRQIYLFWWHQYAKPPSFATKQIINFSKNSTAVVGLTRIYIFPEVNIFSRKPLIGVAFSAAASRKFAWKSSLQSIWPHCVASSDWCGDFNTTSLIKYLCIRFCSTIITVVELIDVIYSDATWGPWRLKSHANRLFVQQIVQDKISNII